MTYAENVKTFTNIELVEDLICNIEQNIESDSMKKAVIANEHIEICKAELLSRLNRDPMDENCGNCKWPYKYKDTFKCDSLKSFMEGKPVNSTIRCSLWGGGEG